METHARLAGEVRRDAAVALGLAAGVLAVHALAARAVFDQREQFLKYPAAAALLLEGRLPAERVLDFSPLYLAVHAAARWALPEPNTAVLALQQLLAGGAAALLFLVLRRHVGLPLAAAGAACTALTPGALLYGFLFEPEACALFLLTALLWLVLRPAPGTPALAAGGCVLALLVLTRPSFLPLAALPLLAPPGAPGRGARWRRTAVFAAPLALTLALAAALSSWRLPPVMNPGQVFFEGNSPLAHGQNAVYPPLVEELQPLLSSEPDAAHQVYRALARRLRGEELTAAAVNRYWAARAAAFIVEHPWAHLRHLARKAALALHRHRQHDMLAAHLADRRLHDSRLPVFPFPLLAGLAVAGVLSSLRSWREQLPLYLLLAVPSAVMLALYVSERQRLPLLPPLALFACLGAARGLRGRASFARHAAPAAVATFALALPTHAESEGRHGWEAFAAGTRERARAVAARERGDLAGASRAAAAAAAADPLRIDQLRPAYVDFGPAGFAAAARAAGAAASPGTQAARFDEALLLYESGAIAEAAAAFAALEREGYRPLRRGATPADPGYQLARCDLARGDRAAARGRLERALAGNPGDPHLLALLLALTGERRYGEELRRYLDDADAAFLFGRACLDAGDDRRAADAFGRLAALLPEFRRAGVYLAAALGRLGRDEEAAAAYLQALARGVDPVLLEADILGVFRRRAEREPPDVGRLRDLGRVLGQFGRLEEAARVLRRARQIEPSHEIDGDLAWLERAAGSGP